MSKLGEDIRAAKDIYEFFEGEAIEVDVNLWLKKAREYAASYGYTEVQKFCAWLHGTIKVES